jgi:hypothetical protein
MTKIQIEIEFDGVSEESFLSDEELNEVLEEFYKDNYPLKNIREAALNR